MWQPSTAQILDLEGVRRRVDRFRFEVCDQAWRPIGDVHPDRGSVPTISNDMVSPRRLSGLKLLPQDANAINVLEDRLRVYMVLQNDAEFLLGSFMWGDESKPQRSWGEEQHSELTDLNHILNQQATRPHGWGRGANITLVMFFLLFRAGFELEDIDTIGLEASRGLREPVSWQPGATWTQMLSDLGDLVGFAAPWFDRHGRVHLAQPPDPALDDVTVPAYDPGTRVVADSIVRSNDLLGAPNDFAVFDGGTDRLRTGRFQTPIQAPHAFHRRGFRIGLVESVQGLETQAQANQAARSLTRTRGIAYEWLTFSSTADPRHDTWDVFEAHGHRWLETSWSLQLRSGGLMQHTGRRTTYEFEG